MQGHECVSGAGWMLFGLCGTGRSPYHEAISKRVLKFVSGKGFYEKVCHAWTSSWVWILQWHKNVRENKRYDAALECVCHCPGSWDCGTQGRGLCEGNFWKNQRAESVSLGTFRKTFSETLSFQGKLYFFPGTQGITGAVPETGNLYPGL